MKWDPILVGVYFYTKWFLFLVGVETFKNAQVKAPGKRKVENFLPLLAEYRPSRLVGQIFIMDCNSLCFGFGGFP